MVGSFLGCCPRAASGHTAAALPSVTTNSRRWMWVAIDPPVGVMSMQRRERYHALPKGRTMLLRCESLEPPMSEVGHSRRSRFGRESACLPIPDIDVPLADACSPRSRNGIYGTSPGHGGSLRPDVRRPDHLAPLLRFVGDELAEIGGRAGKHRATQVSKSRFHVRIDKGRVYFLVELFDNLGRRVSGCADAKPGARLITRQELADGWKVR